MALHRTPDFRVSVPVQLSRFLLLFLIAAISGMLMSIEAGATNDRNIDGVPLPSQLVVSPDNVSWSGVWVGAWGGQLRHILVVERVGPSGDVDVVYAVGANPFLGIKQQWRRQSGRLTGSILTLPSSNSSVEYTRRADGFLNAVFVSGSNRSTALMSKSDDILLKTPEHVAWTPGISEMLDTDIIEGGRRVRLEVVLYKPVGKGPFPLAVINHGSTGNGTDLNLFRVTWSTYALALHLNARGYLVAFPQRRGRGKSDGLYDEGFTPDRSSYSGDVAVMYSGFERALLDLDAAIQALKARSDVAPGRVLLGGQSRGGTLSVAYAGAKPDTVSGVLNFVGGWINGWNKAAYEVNGSLFERGAKFPRQTLWLYGSNDPFYTLKHSKSVFARFEAAGGQGRFISFKQPRGLGHSIISDDRLWQADLDAYLAALSEQ